MTKRLFTELEEENASHLTLKVLKTQSPAAPMLLSYRTATLNYSQQHNGPEPYFEHVSLLLSKYAAELTRSLALTTYTILRCRIRLPRDLCHLICQLVREETARDVFARNAMRVIRHMYRPYICDRSTVIIETYGKVTDAQFVDYCWKLSKGSNK